MQRVTEWSLARTHRLDARRAMEACGRCEYAERGDPETGDDGRARCYQLWADISDEWCAPCVARQPLFQEMKRRRRIERDAFYRLCRVVDRRAQAVAVDAVDPSAEVLES